MCIPSDQAEYELNLRLSGVIAAKDTAPIQESMSVVYQRLSDPY
jgi:hypothetical protein